jgi:hypothetical protein
MCLRAAARDGAASSTCAAEPRALGLLRTRAAVLSCAVLLRLHLLQKRRIRLQPPLLRQGTRRRWRSTSVLVRRCCCRRVAPRRVERGLGRGRPSETGGTPCVRAPFARRASVQPPQPATLRQLPTSHQPGPKTRRAGRGNGGRKEGSGRDREVWFGPGLSSSCPGPHLSRADGLVGRPPLVSSGPAGLHPPRHLLPMWVG